MEIRPKSSNRLFLSTRKGRLVAIPIGKNKLAEISKKVADVLGLEGNFSSHSFRTTAATTAAENGATALQIQKLGDWKDQKVCESYIRSSHMMAGRVAEFLVPEEAKTSAEPPKKRARTEDPMIPTGVSSELLAATRSGVLFVGPLINCTITTHVSYLPDQAPEKLPPEH